MRGCVSVFLWRKQCNNMGGNGQIESDIESMHTVYKNVQFSILKIKLNEFIDSLNFIYCIRHRSVVALT